MLLVDVSYLPMFVPELQRWCEVESNELPPHSLPEQHATHGVYWRRYKSWLHEQNSDRYCLAICHP